MGKLRKMAAMASAAAVLAVGLPVSTANAVAGPPFSDVDANTPHSNDIYWIRQRDLDRLAGRQRTERLPWHEQGRAAGHGGIPAP